MIRPRTRRLLFGALAAGALGLAAAGVSTSAQFANPKTVFRPMPQTTVISGTSSGTIFEVINSGTAALGSYGIVGAVPNGPLAAGVVGAGLNGAAGNIGILGYDLGPNGFGGAGYDAYPAQGSTNSSNQTIGLYGAAPNGYGIVGQTSVQSGTTQYAGVEGQDLAGNDGVNDGVYGTTSNGGFGVKGTSGDGALGGVEGIGTSGDGVNGQSSMGYGVTGSSDSSYGVYAVSNTGNGIYGSGADGVDGAGTFAGVSGSTSSNGGTGVLGDSGIASGGYGVWGVTNSADGEGVVGVAPSSCVCSAGVTAGVYGQGYVGVVGQSIISSNYPFDAVNDVGADVFFIDNAGNYHAHGSLIAFAKTRSGNVAQAYGATTTARTVEDTGNGTILNGAGAVRLDPAFADMMDGAGYEVFITPEGDSRGLYVTSKTATSFVVRESQGGRSSIAFSYRVVAKLYGHSSERASVARNEAAFGVPGRGMTHGSFLAPRRARVALALSPTRSAAYAAKKRLDARASVVPVRLPAALQSFMHRH